MTVLGAIDAAEMRRVSEQPRARTGACVRLARQRTPAVEGRVDVNFVISPAGSAASAPVASSTVADSELGTCLASATRACTLQEPPGGGVGVVTCLFAVPQPIALTAGAGARLSARAPRPARRRRRDPETPTSRRW
ncbi:MAG: AgmX/PglI C-terminal domain-containing protein [Myxococcota bacterium]|jgi:hypothetical protein